LAVFLSQMKPMKVISLSLLLIILLTACSSAPFSASQESRVVAPSNRINDEFSIWEVTADTFVITDESFFDSNVLVARMPDGEVLIASSPFETEGAIALIDWVKSKFSPSKIVAINTHFHADGTGGNDAYNKAGVETWASKETQELHRQKGAVMRERSAADFSDDKLKRRILARQEVPATKTFKQKDGLDLSFGGEHVKVFYPGPAHSPDNVIVYLPKRGVLFGGCMIRSANSNSLGYLGHADLLRWEESARRVLAFSPKIVVPGHGKVGGPELIENTIRLASTAKEEQLGKSKDTQQ
jgi:glyoxylase-like metal-dependent hydrolase (beta-lactamase superfamily II)